jgi:UDP-glucose 4-epimerase
MVKNILIIGGLGYLGSRIAATLKSTYHNVIVGASISNLVKIPKELCDCQIRRYDLSSIESCVDLLKGVDIVIHTSGLNSEDCFNSPRQALIVNGLYTSNLLQASKASFIEKYIYFSTAHVYSNNLEGDFNEMYCPKNLHPYATSHLNAESQILWFGQNSDTKVVIFRLSNCFGFEIVENSNCWNLFVNNICMQGVMKKEINVKSNPYIQRNFLPIIELCNIIIFFIEKKSSSNEIFNIGNLKSTSLEEITIFVKLRIESILNFTPVVNYSSPKSEFKINLNYSILKLINAGYSFEDNFVNEIDNLIIYLANKNNE